ncbi:molybdate ABC transporter substrate-binding protein [Ruegeria arenilitoris]|uniref:molybdate ABC transporter substrate-binding protein n=1 Tax=Ruegeria arenilitoris TaxID=1173585 RepID=UPI00147DE0A2|nr:molybdate ABC transporter substrate-binding protein [Ruegeria arenilitoris]
MILSLARRCAIAALVLGTVTLAPLRVSAAEVLVFAAASLKTALDEIAPIFEQQTGHQVTVSYAASSVLARQIQLGAPADVFIFANVDWMDVLQDQGLIDVASRVDLLGNGLVLIGGSDQAQIGHIQADTDLIARLGSGHLAMALVDAVPAGIYGKAALQNLGLWEGVQPRIAQTENVRAALALVAAGAAPLGIVYQSDAQVEDRVKVVASFPSELHPPIIYPAAVTTSAPPEARLFLDHLQSDTAQTIFTEQGFALPGN